MASLFWGKSKKDKDPKPQRLKKSQKFVSGNPAGTGGKSTLARNSKVAVAQAKAGRTSALKSTLKLWSKNYDPVNTVQDYEGKPLLSVAAQWGHVETMRFLIHEGAKVNAKAPSNLTAMHAAASGNRPKAIELLCQYKGEVDAQDTKGWTPLHFASELSYTRVAEALLKNRSDPNIANIEGKTPFHYASQHSPDIILAMLKCERLDINKQDGAGWTALHYATFWRRADTVEMLLEKKADKSIPNEKGEVARDMTTVPAIVALLDRFTILDEGAQKTPTGEVVTKPRTDTMEARESFARRKKIEDELDDEDKIALGLIKIPQPPPSNLEYSNSKVNLKSNVNTSQPRAKPKPSGPTYTVEQQIRPTPNARFSAISVKRQTTEPAKGVDPALQRKLNTLCNWASRLTATDIRPKIKKTHLRLEENYFTIQQLRTVGASVAAIKKKMATISDLVQPRARDPVRSEEQDVNQQFKSVIIKELSVLTQEMDDLDKKVVVFAGEGNRRLLEVCQVLKVVQEEVSKMQV